MLISSFNFTESQINTVNNGKDAFQELIRATKARVHYDFAFIDHNMPGVSGLQAIELYRGEYNGLVKHGYNVQQIN